MLAPPSQKLLNLYNIDLDNWLEATINQIGVYTDREVVVRLKQSRSIRQNSDTMESALQNDIFCLVTFSSIAAGAKNIWFLRRYRADNLDAWMIAGYGMGPNGLLRWTSRPLVQRTEAGALWAGIMRDPDLSSSDLLVSLEIPMVARQAFQVKTSVVSGAGNGGVSASGTGSPNLANTATTNNSTNVSGTNNAGNTGVATTAAANITSVLPEQQGITMQWWIKDVALPITRSCLMAGAL